MTTLGRMLQEISQLNGLQNKPLLEINFEVAIEKAKKLDDFFEEHGRPRGPLHGLPVTLKDQFHVIGLNTTMGYASWINTFEGDKDSPLVGQGESQLVADLVSLGAVVIGKTTCVQSLGYGETNNNLLGYNFNPVNPKLSSGGSSGGKSSKSKRAGKPAS